MLDNNAQHWRVLPVYTFDLDPRWRLNPSSVERGPDWFRVQMVSSIYSTAQLAWRQSYVHEPLLDEQLRRARHGYDLVPDSLVVEKGAPSAEMQTGTQVFDVPGGWTVAHTVLIMDVPELGGTVEILVGLSASETEFPTVAEDFANLIDSIRLGNSTLPINELLAEEFGYRAKDDDSHG
ncbi:hypothetical protein [Gordonia sp. (in: high G+C Gram-positive bacteria)]|uniref:hypothetical protein n=1 Tax=Gordonia sp. (in: high G+C Gram-positive bacteria) TaxID=84139 RepID=UPI0039E27EAB